MDNIGILDPNGKNINPLNNKSYSEQYRKLSKIWSKFPAYDKAKDFIDIIKNNQVTLVVSGTGSGKTVLFPKYVLHALNYDAKIAITLPKQIITQSSAEFSAKTLDVELGQEVGYKYRGSSKNSYNKNTKLLYATDGTIVAKLLNDPSLQEFNAVIIDEAHERKVQIDFLLYLLKQTLKKRKDFKVIIMSATINNEIFQSYFNEFKFYNLNISGRTNYPIKSIFLDKQIKSSEYLKKGNDIITEILKKNENSDTNSKDILFFITSSNEAFDVCKKIEVITNKNNLPNTYCIEVYSGMDKEKQLIAQDKDLYKKEGSFDRKLVIATNVAESSLTIDGIKYVVESGYELLGTYDPVMKARKLERVYISHAQAKQRMGRAGRTEPGVCYHLYTEDFFNNKLKKFPDPDIRKQDITGECLKLLCTDYIQDVPKLINILTEFIEPPREPYIKLAINNLKKLGAINDNKITLIGKIMGDLNVDPIFGIALLHSSIYKCTYEIIDIIAIVTACRSNLANVFSNPNFILKNNESLKEDRKEYQRVFKNLDEKYKKKEIYLKVNMVIILVFIIYIQNSETKNQKILI